MFSKFGSRIILLTILLISFLFRIYKLDSLYLFDWDQEDDAKKVMEMINLKKPRLIGPRVANDSGFFVGPFHYYFLVPFYIASKGNPLAGAYASVFIELITTLVLYFVSRKIFGQKVAYLAAFLYSIVPLDRSWNVMYNASLSLLIFYLCYQLTIGKNKFFPLLIFLYSFSATTHLVSISLIVPIIISLLLTNKKPSLKQSFYSLVLFIIPLCPLILFDLRHQFINLKSLLNFISSSGNGDNPSYLFLRTYWRSINLLFLKNYCLIFIERILIILSTIISILLLKNKKIKILLFSWLLTPIVLLSFYHGNIPEYYYGSANIIIPIIISVLIIKILSTKLLLSFCLIILIFQTHFFPSISTGITLKNKMDAVSYIVNQKQDPIFNVSYDLPVGWNNGYQYLFSYLGKLPQNTPEGHLYSISLSSNPSSGEIVYKNNTLSVVRK